MACDGTNGSTKSSPACYVKMYCICSDAALESFVICTPRGTIHVSVHWLYQNSDQTHDKDSKLGDKPVSDFYLYFKNPGKKRPAAQCTSLHSVLYPNILVYPCGLHACSSRRNSHLKTARRPQLEARGRRRRLRPKMRGGCCLRGFPPLEGFRGSERRLDRARDQY